MQQKNGIREYVFPLRGKIATENAAALENELGKVLADHPDCTLVFDAENLVYISSAGLRVLLKQIRQSGKRLQIRNVSAQVYEILAVTGFTDLMDVEKKLRKISTDHCIPVGSGRSSTVYRLDSETIVKKYDPHVPLERIRQEMELSRKAFVAGVPTAIPFDMVRADDSYGIVFEHIAPADTVGQTISAHPERFDELTREFAAALKRIHSKETQEKDGFPSVRDRWLNWAEGMTPYYSEEENEFLAGMVRRVPERCTMVHCDFHENNVLVRGDTLIMIDMADIGCGHPVFDLACLAFRAHVSRIPGRNAHHGLTADDMQMFYERVLQFYFETQETAKLQEIRDICDAFGLVRSALFPMKHIQVSAGLRQIHIDDARRNLFPRMEWARAQLLKLCGGE